jgi:hypothetical protein
MPSDKREAALAKAFHNAYERLAFECGWSTQGNCRVEFEELPEENRLTLLATIREVMLPALQRERDEAERECIQARCEDCSRGDMPTPESDLPKAMWWHKMDICDSSEIYELRRRREEKEKSNG